MNERIKRPQLSIITGILKLLAFFAGILVVSVVVGSLWGDVLPEWAKYIVYLIFAVLCITVILRLLTEYEYTIKNSRLVVERYVFRRPKRIAGFNITDISYIGRYLPRSFSGRTARATYKSGKAGVVYIIYAYGGHNRCVILSPSKKMFDFLASNKEF